jgi:hypothetical protein
MSWLFRGAEIKIFGQLPSTSTTADHRMSSLRSLRALRTVSRVTLPISTPARAGRAVPFSLSRVAAPSFARSFSVSSRAFSDASGAFNPYRHSCIRQVELFADWGSFLRVLHGICRLFIADKLLVEKLEAEIKHEREAAAEDPAHPEFLTEFTKNGVWTVRQSLVCAHGHISDLLFDYRLTKERDKTRLSSPENTTMRRE